MKNKKTVGALFALGVAFALGGCGSADPAPPEEVGRTVQAWGTPPVIPDWELVDEELPPEIAALMEQGGKALKLLSNLKSGYDFGRAALEFLGVIASADQIQQERFATLAAKLDDVGAALSSQALIQAREMRISDMRSYVNSVNAFASRSANGFVNERLLSGSELTELGNAKTFSQNVAQAATNSIAFRKFAVSNPYPGAQWPTYIHDRPAVQDGLVFDWRLGTTELVHLITARIAIMALTRPNFRGSGESMNELTQYRAALQGLYDQIFSGIKCGFHRADELMVVCADIHSGFSGSNTVYEPRCGSSYSAGLCNDRIAAETKIAFRAVMMRLPLFELRALIDSISTLLTLDPDLTGSASGAGVGGIRIQGSGQSSCLGEFQGFTIDDWSNPYNTTVDETRWYAFMQECNGSNDQRWSYDRLSGRITNSAGACLRSAFNPGSAVTVESCSDSPGERWTYDPESGTIENAYHTVLAAPPTPWLSMVPVNEERGKPGSQQAWDDARDPYNLGYWHWGTTGVSSDPYGRGGDVAIDGDTNGEWYHGSVTHTTAGLNQWGGGQYWTVDLHQPYWVGQVVLWNRTDCCWDRLSHFQLAAWDPQLGDWRTVADLSNFVPTSSGPITIPFGATTQYLMVQKTDADILSLAEVEILGF
jgi:hypothetical protein